MNKGLTVLAVLTAVLLDAASAVSASLPDLPELHLDKVAWGMSEADVHAAYDFLGRDAPTAPPSAILIALGTTASLETHDVHFADCLYNLSFYAPAAAASGAAPGLDRVTAALKADQPAQCRDKAISAFSAALGRANDLGGPLEERWMTARTAIILDSHDRYRSDGSKLVITYLRSRSPG